VGLVDRMGCGAEVFAGSLTQSVATMSDRPVRPKGLGYGQMPIV
jgi:hypothetical protein